jgi:hypothetical protein
MAKKQEDPVSRAELLAVWDDRVAAARKALEGASEDHLAEIIA